MVYKCCVPGCTSSSRIPSHVLPKDSVNAEAWLKAIGRDDMIGAPKNTLSKLRICGIHFSEDMLILYTSQRRLKNNALPTLYLPLQVNIALDSADTISNANIANSENVEYNPDLSILPAQEENQQQISANTISNANIANSGNVEYNPDLSILPAQEENQQQIIHIKSVYTSNVHHVRNKLRHLKKMLHNKKAVIKKQRGKINQLRCENYWEKITEDLPGTQKIFFEMLSSNLMRAPQDNILHKNGHNFLAEEVILMYNIDDEYDEIEDGHRYKIKQKALALTLYKTMGKRAYTCLQSIFCHIPSIQTLQLTLQKIPLFPGLNPLILKHLKNTAQNISIKEKVCILMWDEVSIQPKLTYDVHRDIICGLEDWGNNRTGKVADHVLVFMLRGLKSGWKMPISYNFCQKQTKTSQLTRCIKEHIKEINNAGFHIVGTVCDQGSSNTAAIKELLLRTDMKRNFEKRAQRQTFEVANEEVVPLFDPPHLIKGVRNNLLTKDLAINCTNNTATEVASWDVIKRAWLIDKSLNIIRPQLKKLTQEHVMENKIKKMRVKHAAQVLSGTMASFIETVTK